MNDELDPRILAARQHGLPDELADRLTGDTPDEIANDAKVLAAAYRWETRLRMPPVGGGAPDDRMYEPKDRHDVESIVNRIWDSWQS